MATIPSRSSVYCLGSPKDILTDSSWGVLLQKLETRVGGVQLANTKIH